MLFSVKPPENFSMGKCKKTQESLIHLFNILLIPCYGDAMVEWRTADSKDVGLSLICTFFYFRQKNRERRKILVFAKTYRLAPEKNGEGNGKSPEISGPYHANIFPSPDL